MAPSAIHVIGIDPGYTTGYCRITVPRKCFYGNQPSEILDWKYGEFHGPEDEQAIQIAKGAVVLQGMDYKVGPAIVIEDFDLMIKNPTTDSELLSPVRIAAKVQLLSRLNMAGDSRVVLQGRTDAKNTFNDERLKAHGYYVPGPDHVRDAIRQALMALRRAAQSEEFRDELWDRSACQL
jgi:hypothetical protein